ncbi:MAG: UDP-2,3-diacylglucosamine diphosphatase [Spongiibacteraceae bacterium]|nr:UDP-2,3-diacylglucosamine diphosphatase [Spongiibacteraceae bacterium]
MSTFFISDLHLDESRPHVTRAFFSWLQQHAVQAQALYILGDFFEAWVGDDNSTELIRDVIAALKQQTNNGTPIYLMHGNRDFTIGQKFCEQTGCQLINDPSVINLYGKPILLMHGDNLCTEDVQYLKLRAQIRNPAWQQEQLSKPLHERLAMAKYLREASAEAKSNKAENIMDVTASEVKHVMQENQTKLLIHGHTHRPKIHSMEDGNTRIVLGDWDQQGWYLHVHSNGSYDLNHFVIN